MVALVDTPKVLRTIKLIALDLTDSSCLLAIADRISTLAT